MKTAAPATRVEFEGQDIFITVGDRMCRVYPARQGTYWVDMERGYGRIGIETGVLTVDDFGNMVDGFDGAHQRHHFRQILH